MKYDADGPTQNGLVPTERSGTGSSVGEGEAALRGNYVHFQNLKKCIKITKKVLHAVEPTQRCSFKLLNRKICSDFDLLPGVCPPGSGPAGEEMTVMLN